MRAALLLIPVLLLVPAVDAAGWKLIAQGGGTAASWHTDAFTAEGSQIWVRFGHVSLDEIVGHAVTLHDGDGDYLAGRFFVGVGGRMLDLTGRAPGVAVTTDTLPGLANRGTLVGDVVFSCDAACNPSRQFNVVVSAGGGLDAWGYGLFVMNNGSVTARVNGTESWAYSSRDFDGVAAHAALRGTGATVVEDARMTLRAENNLVGMFVKDGAPARQLVAQSAAGERACPCFFGDWPAGDHTFRHSFVDANGREAYLVAADVEFP